MAIFLITGSRAPSALELVRNLSKHGHTVVCADSLRFPLSRFSRHCHKHYTIAQPENQPEQFKADLLNIIDTDSVDYLVPTCEEVFYIASIKSELEQYCSVLCEDITLLNQLHSKYQLLQLASNTDIAIPKTTLVDSKALREKPISALQNCVIKKEYSRFGTDVLINPNQVAIEQLLRQNTENSQHLIQEKIKGEEYCTYTIALNGKIKAHTAYKLSYRLAQSAGFYFKHEEVETLKRFVEQFIKQHHFSGQIAFDFIINEKGAWILECNPRASSGLHLLKDLNIGTLLTDEHEQINAINPQPAMMTSAMLCLGLPLAIKKNAFKAWRQDFAQARSILGSAQDPAIYFSQHLSFFEIALYAIKHKTNFRDASTYGIKWEGKG